MTSSARILPADADKMSTEQLTEAHVPHPGIPRAFVRSCLVIGSRGAGKTFVLRHRRHTAHPDAIYISLQKTLRSLASDAGVGGRTVIYPPDLAATLTSKAMAILATTISQRVAERGLPEHVVVDALRPLLPRGIQPLSGASDLPAIAKAVNGSRLDEWPEPARHLLFDFIEQVYELTSGSLALFFDRADDAPLPALSLVLGLLDQSLPCLVVVAARPSVSRVLAGGFDPTLIAGDHYDVFHLGSQPYAEAWRTFLLESLTRFLAVNEVLGVPVSELSWLPHFARDSIRDALLLAQAISTAGGSNSLDARREVLLNVRAQRIDRARTALHPAVSDFAAFTRLVQRRCAKALDGPPLPVVLRLGDASLQPQLSLLPAGQDRRTLTLLDGMRAEAFHYPPGTLWTPYEIPTRVELAPLLAWNGRNDKWIQ